MHGFIAGSGSRGAARRRGGFLPPLFVCLLMAGVAVLLLPCAKVDPALQIGTQPPSTDVRARAVVGPAKGAAARIVATLEIVDGRLTWPSRRARDPGEMAGIDSSLDAYSAMVRGHLRAGGKAGALDAALALAETRDADPAAWLTLGQVLVRVGALEESVVALLTALDLTALDLALDARSADDALRRRILDALARALGADRRHADAADVWWRLVGELQGRSATEARSEASYDVLRLAARELAVSLHLAGRSEEAGWVYRDLVGRLEGDALPGLLFRPWESGLAKSVATLPASALGPEVRVDTGGTAEAAETTVVAAGDVLVAGWNDLRQAGEQNEWRLGAAISTDGGLTWSDEIVRPPVPLAGAFEGDPMTAVDPRTGHLWVGALDFTTKRVYVARRDPNGGFSAPVVVQQDVFDKVWMAAGPDPSNANATRLYVAYSFPEQLRISTNLGQSFTATTNLPFGIAFLPRVASDGTLYVMYQELNPDISFGDAIRVVRSEDGGLTLSTPKLVALRMDNWPTQQGPRAPGQFRTPAIPNLAVDPLSETLYATWFDTTGIVDGKSDLDLYFSRSTNGGNTWTTPKIIPQAIAGDQFFPWMEVGPDGRLHLVYFDGRHTNQADDSLDGMLDVYYATSTDQGDTWAELRLTDASFGTAGIDWGPFQGQFVGDYLGLAVTTDAVVAVYPKASPSGDLDIWARRIVAPAEIFDDAFETGDTDRWNDAVP